MPVSLLNQYMLLIFDIKNEKVKSRLKGILVYPDL